MTLAENLDARWASFEEMDKYEVYALLRLRQDIFILEQASFYADIDGKDPELLHYLVKDRDTGTLVGAIRLSSDTELVEARIGRVVVASEGRGTGLGRKMMLAGVKKARELVPACKIHVSAQAHLEAFYGSLGFQTVSDEYDEDGIAHVDMVHLP
ncbi:GNAT family N-acetyltransferase [Roseibium porphyridii]|uniref:GNAT family N-acetyltransferase n=1 Tax=Roseibium porphyridii TaxID=2866279 RepID=A0ABY8F8B1_9HYPH|nr:MULTISPECIES: GNAT family N-acetyltransferase [Stappiaceae]QFT31068.1 putative acyltransferase [Labrenzia sp. THAF82]WFE91676.1 GNAT family N-acetyltransferase [Roseibium sp. KMA01]